MVYNGLSPIRPQPYFINKGLVKKKEDEESSQSSRSQQSQNEQEQINSYPQKKNEPEQPKINDRPIQRTMPQQLAESKASQQEAIASRDAKIKSATVNIAQILKDFGNTAKAIAAPPDLTEEVNSYLALVEKQASKSTPDSKIIKSNLKNASILLDNYITETLQRPSKVVENWIDALFLQKINYKFDEEEINPTFLVKFPDGQQKEASEKTSQQNAIAEGVNQGIEQKKTVHVPTDETLKKIFIQAKKQSYANNFKKAMESFKQALDRATEVSDKETKSKILYEIGKIYDKTDYLEQALTSYNKSLNVSNDLGVKTQVHYSMAQIYDDVAQFEPAINHYMSSISYAGENDNFTAQSTSLTKIGNIHADKYDKEALNFLLEANLIATESKNSRIKGYVSSNVANAYSKFNEPQNALKFYSSAIKEYEDAKSPNKVAINYQRAAELMKSYNNPQKAKSLMKKALVKAIQSDDDKLIVKIQKSLNSM